MNPQNIIQKMLLIFLAGLTVISALPAQINQNAQAWGTPVNGLQMSLSRDAITVQPSPIPVITLSLRNTGTDSLYVLLGAGCGPGRIGPNLVVLNLTDSSGNSRRIHGGGQDCGGRLQLIEVPLPPGAEYSIPLKFPCVARQNEQPCMPDGTYSLRAELEGNVETHTFVNMGGIQSEATVHHVGKALVTSSNLLEIHFPSQ
jgi:hypothetical protein